MTDWLLCVVSEVHRGEWCEDHYRTLIAWAVTARNRRGRRFAYAGPVPTPDQPRAERLVATISGYARSHPEWTPVDNKHWNEIDPVYGSEEYQSQGTEAARAQRERDDDPWYGEDSVRDSYMA